MHLQLEAEGSVLVAGVRVAKSGGREMEAVLRALLPFHSVPDSSPWMMLLTPSPEPSPEASPQTQEV